MKYNFDKIIDRYGRDALAVEAIGNMDGFAPGAPKEGFNGPCHIRMNLALPFGRV